MQNRGTAALSNLQLDVTVDGKSKTFYINSLQPGDIHSETIPVNTVLVPVVPAGGSYYHQPSVWN